MRKITTEAAEAFFNRKDFKKSNTEVHNSPNGDTTMLLHDNEIAVSYTHLTLPTNREV